MTRVLRIVDETYPEEEERFHGWDGPNAGGWKGIWRYLTQWEIDWDPPWPEDVVIDTRQRFPRPRWEALPPLAYASWLHARGIRYQPPVLGPGVLPIASRAFGVNSNPGGGVDLLTITGNLPLVLIELGPQTPLAAFRID